MKAKPFQIDALKTQIQKQFKGALIFGLDLSVVEDCAKQIIPMIVPQKDDFSLIKIHKNQLKETPSLLLDEGNAISLLGTRKLIWLKETDNSSFSQIEDYFNHLKSDTFLLMTAENLVKTSALKIFCENAPDILTIACYQDEEKDIRFLIQTVLKENKITADENIITLLYNRLPENRQTIKNELEKLVTYLGTQTTVNEADVQAIIPDITTATTDILSFAVASGQQQKADTALKILLTNGENPVAITRILMAHFNKLLWGVDLLAHRKGSEEICRKILRANQFRLKEEIMRQVCCWPKEDLLKVLKLLSETEKQIKSTGFPPELVIERTVTMITGRGKKLSKGR